MEKSKMIAKRRNVVEELMITERDYVKDLDILVNAFYLPMSNLMSAEDITSVFANISVLQKLNQEVLAALEKQVNLDNPETWVFGAVFNQMASFMKMYTQYCSSQESAGLIVEKARKKSKVLDQFLKEKEFTESVNNLSLGAYLIKPVQRICKYPLLLKVLMSVTEDDHPDKENLTEASKKMESLLDHLNEMKRKSERMSRLVEIHKKISGCGVVIIKPHRKFIREGELVKISKGNVQARQFFLFNDMLLYTKPQGGVRNTYVFKGHIELDKCLCTCIPDTPKVKNAFKLVRMDDKKKNYVIFATTPEIRDSWANDVMGCIDVILNKLRDESKGEFAKDGFLSVGSARRGSRIGNHVPEEVVVTSSTPPPRLRSSTQLMTSSDPGSSRDKQLSSIEAPKRREMLSTLQKMQGGSRSNLLLEEEVKRLAKESRIETLQEQNNKVKESESKKSSQDDNDLRRARSPKDVRDAKEIKESKEIKEVKEKKEVKEPKQVAKETKEAKEAKEPKESKEVKDIGDASPSQLEAAVKQVANLQAKHGEWLIAGVNGSKLVLLETGRGVVNLRDALKEDQCNFVLLTLRLTQQQVSDQPRHIFMTWRGPKANARMKVKANELQHVAVKTLSPNHGHLEVIGKNHFNEETVSVKWLPQAGSHVID